MESTYVAITAAKKAKSPTAIVDLSLNFLILRLYVIVQCGNEDTGIVP
jgi:hypothetical protein